MPACSTAVRFSALRGPPCKRSKINLVFFIVYDQGFQLRPYFKIIDTVKVDRFDLSFTITAYNEFYSEISSSLSNSYREKKQTLDATRMIWYRTGMTTCSEPSLGSTASWGVPTSPDDGTDLKIKKNLVYRILHELAIPFN